MIKFCAFALLLLLSTTVEAVDFATEVQPALEAKCLRCHNPNNPKGDLSFATREGLLAQPEVLIAGNALDSLIHQVSISLDGDEPEMPKDEGEPLSESEADALARWIDEGATWPEGLVLKEASKADLSWWAYQPLKETSAQRSVDAFLESALVESGLEMNGPADRRTLIRRATYDLTGLPPSPREVAEFVAAPELDIAYDALIERLLASPRYGERWGRHWLDVVRFGESNGFERNVIIPTLWPFRDYVIDSINADKPFDEFIREHLAGDVFGKDDPEVAVGSAFLVAGPYDNVGNQDAVQVAQIRANTLDEMIRSTSEAFLGMTVGCARCHDHKFDPILQRDYYSLSATFSGVKHGNATLATPAERKASAATLAPLKAKKAKLESAQRSLRNGILKRGREQIDQFAKAWTRPPIDRSHTEDRIEPTEAKFVRLICEAQDTNPNLKNGFGIEEFEIWSAGENSENVALRGIASGEARKIEDFEGAYSADLAIDGKGGARFIAASDRIQIELAEKTTIDRIVFYSAKGEENPEHRKFRFISEYRIESSLDGEHWKTISSSADRTPIDFDAEKRPHTDHRLFLLTHNEQEKTEQARLAKDVAAINAEIGRVPKLPAVWIGTRDEKLAANAQHLFIGGSPQRPGEVVPPASLSTLQHALPGYSLASDSGEAERRVGLAEWITSDENALALRVLANRLWHYHFGTGIVNTPNDFGYMGGRPSHPELLDFLANQLRENDWQLKPMHRLIMKSRAYRQSSDWVEAAANADGDSRLLWRFPPRRLSAEEIRDTILSVSGQLDLDNTSGPGFRLYHYMQDNVATYVPLDEHGPETYRRAVYHQNARASVVDLMTDFDQPDCAFSTPRRSETTTPLQALTMLNHTFTMDMSEALAERIDASKDPVSTAFRLVYQREPTADERTRCEAVRKQHGSTAVCRALLNSSELIHLD